LFWIEGLKDKINPALGHQLVWRILVAKNRVKYFKMGNVLLENKRTFGFGGKEKPKTWKNR
jgi:hypothetical protein